VGASPGSTDNQRTLRRLCHELKAGCREIPDKIPEDAVELRAAFQDYLERACAQRPVVILLDGVNQLDSAADPTGMEWLPTAVPANARFVLSAVDGPALRTLRQRFPELREIELGSLSAADSEAIIEQFRRRYHKQFEPDQGATLLAKTDAGTPFKP
jgi:hypothetical protein